MLQPNKQVLFWTMVPYATWLFALETFDTLTLRINDLKRRWLRPASRLNGWDDLLILQLVSQSFLYADFIVVTPDFQLNRYPRYSSIFNATWKAYSKRTMVNATTPALIFQVLVQLLILHVFVEGLLLFDSLSLTHQTFAYNQQVCCSASN